VNCECDKWHGVAKQGKRGLDIERLINDDMGHPEGDLYVCMGCMTSLKIYVGVKSMYMYQLDKA